MRRWVADRVRRAVRDMASFHGSPAQVAWGAALGTFIAFTPTIGLQIIIVLALATILRANRASAFAFVWITNAATAVPLYTFCYAVGRHFVGGPGVASVGRRLGQAFNAASMHSPWEVIDRVRELLKLGGEVFWPLTVGGCLVGLVAGMLVYPVVYVLMQIARRMVAQLPHGGHRRAEQDQPSSAA